jgi:hypothetical protein
LVVLCSVGSRFGDALRGVRRLPADLIRGTAVLAGNPLAAAETFVGVTQRDPAAAPT